MWVESVLIDYTPVSVIMLKTPQMTAESTFMNMLNSTFEYRV
jgi:hypothetical protein